jgi:DNA-binding NarL/FixJ family response regulator
MTLTSIKVLCVDDNLLVGGSLKAKIKRLKAYEWMGHLTTADHLVDEAVRLNPDVVLLDVDMPGRDPFAALAELSKLCPDMRVLMLSGQVSRTLVDRAMAAGAWGYFSKEDDIESMLSTIVDTIRGDFALGPNASAALHC